MSGKRTTAGLLIAFSLGLAAAGVYLIGEHRRTQIIEHGIPAQGVITADHDTEIDHWYTVGYTVLGQARSADLRAPWLIDKMPVGRAVTVYVDPDHPERIVTADGYATPVWTSAPGWLAVLAIFAAFISIVGRWGRTRQTRSGGD
ncbi:hypothetical protein Apa02nite_083590 [Actinoplanes palleronii]|uniref:DUF3592 domain-containing protein n=2 Tax=Actinoplanes palleronii TaxID=113570 RepID=A0ABQ4BPN6_9ACTN|nr:hypothetical protein Apa02nite_083590 [Actinoplanes palleronii]